MLGEAAFKFSTMGNSGLQKIRGTYEEYLISMGTTMAKEQTKQDEKLAAREKMLLERRGKVDKQQDANVKRGKK